MSPKWSGPRVMWTESIRRSGQDPTQLRLPGCEEKVATSIEIPWNYVHRDDDLVADMAAAFKKVEANLRPWPTCGDGRPAGCHVRSAGAVSRAAVVRVSMRRHARL